MKHQLRNLGLFSVLVAVGLVAAACGSDSNPTTPTPAPSEAPLAPTGLTATATGPNEIELTWTAPAAGPARHPVTGYRIEWSVDGIVDWVPAEPPHSGTGANYRHSGLDPDATRYYLVFALSAGGDSPASNLARAMTNPPAAPLAPTDLTATGAGPGAIELAWTAPASDPGRGSVTGYRIEWSLDGVSDWMPAEPPHMGVQTTYRHHSLDLVTTRHYRVFALSAGGEGLPSNVAQGEAIPDVSGYWQVDRAPADRDIQPRTGCYAEYIVERWGGRFTFDFSSSILWLRIDQDDNDLTGFWWPWTPRGGEPDPELDPPRVRTSGTLEDGGFTLTENGLWNSSEMRWDPWPVPTTSPAPEALVSRCREYRGKSLIMSRTPTVYTLQVRDDGTLVGLRRTHSSITIGDETWTLTSGPHSATATRLEP